MMKTVKLILIVNEEQNHQLHTYACAFKHEVYKIAGVFQKEQRICAFPYRYISNQIAWTSKQQVVTQAQQYYRLKQRHPTTKLDFMAVWSGESVVFKESGHIQFLLGTDQMKRYLIIPFMCDEELLNVLRCGLLKELTLKQRGEHWFAFLHMESRSTSLSDFNV